MWRKDLLKKSQDRVQQISDAAIFFRVPVRSSSLKNKDIELLLLIMYEWPGLLITGKALNFVMTCLSLIR